MLRRVNYARNYAGIIFTPLSSMTRCSPYYTRIHDVFVPIACVHELEIYNNCTSYFLTCIWLDTASQPRPLVSILKKKHPTTGEGASVATKHQKIQPTAEESLVERAPVEQSMCNCIEWCDFILKFHRLTLTFFRSSIPLCYSGR